MSPGSLGHICQTLLFLTIIHHVLLRSSIFWLFGLLGVVVCETRRQWWPRPKVVWRTGSGYILGRLCTPVRRYKKCCLSARCETVQWWSLLWGDGPKKKKNPCNNKWWCIALMVYAAVSRMFWPCVAGSAWSATQEDSVRQRHSTSDRWGSESSNGKQRNVEGWRRCPGQLETPLWESSPAW